MTIKIYERRIDPKYSNDLTNLLDLDSKNGLIATAIPLKEPKKILNDKYAKFIRIDLCGISGSTLLIKRADKPYLEVYKRFFEIFTKLDEINSKGIFIKFRFLFSYLYSDFSFALIRAEKSKKRATINEPQFLPSFDIEEELAEEEFISSAAYRNQTKSLENLQAVAIKYNLFDSNNPNSLQIRFTPTPIHLSTLIINSVCFSDSYLYSKAESQNEVLANSYPIISLNQSKHKLQFNSIEDNFRYLWNLQTTLHHMDATYYDDIKKQGLNKIKRPYDLTFDNKARRIQEIVKMNEYNSVKPINSKTIAHWKFHIKQSVLNSTKIHTTIKTTETIFIACSWRDNIAGEAEPNDYAMELSKYLKEDFDETFQIKMVLTGPAENVFDKIYTYLKQSTLGIIFITKDISGKDGKFYSKPNVYFEQGFLISHLDSRNTKRVISLVKKGTVSTSNTNDIGYIDFDPDKFIFRYGKIIQWLHDNCETVESSHIRVAKDNHKRRLLTFITNKNMDIRIYEQLVKELDGIKED